MFHSFPLPIKSWPDTIEQKQMSTFLSIISQTVNVPIAHIEIQKI